MFDAVKGGKVSEDALEPGLVEIDPEPESEMPDPA